MACGKLSAQSTVSPLCQEALTVDPADNSFCVETQKCSTVITLVAVVNLYESV